MNWFSVYRDTNVKTVRGVKKRIQRNRFLAGRKGRSGNKQDGCKGLKDGGGFLLKSWQIELTKRGHTKTKREVVKMKNLDTLCSFS
jgi:hypothetical protein